MIEWIDDFTAKVNGGGPVEFVGIIRGEGMPPVRYVGPTREAVLDGLVLDEWIYVVRERVR